MAAINVHVGTQAIEDREGESCALGGLEAARSCIPEETATHNGLTRMVWIRRTLEDLVENRPLYVAQGSDVGKKGAEAQQLYLVIDPPFAKNDIPWMPAAVESISAFALFGQAGKMACVTWDLPAGSPSTGGACPGATAGQTVVPLRIRKRVEHAVGAPVKIRETICQICVSGETRVLVCGRGWVRIDELVGLPEFSVWSGKAWRRTRAVMTTVAPVVEVRTNWGYTIKATADHQLLTPAGMVAIEDLEVGDQLVHEPMCGPDSGDSAVPGTWRSTSLLSVRVEQAPYRTAVEAHFPTEWSFDVGLFLGYIQGDGSVSGGKYPQVVIAMSEQDAEDVRHLQEIVASWCGTTAEVKTRQVPPNGFCSIPKPQTSVAWHVKALVEFLEDLGYDRGTAEARRIPHAIWTASCDGVRGFLSGLFSTDGSVTIGAGKIEVSLASISEGLLRDVQLLLFELGIRSSICPYRTSNEQRLAAGYHRLYKLGINAFDAVHRFHALVGFQTARKRERLAAALDTKARTRRPVYLRRLPVVTSITPMLIDEPVYDLVDVGEEHQFVANGISVSNCYAGGGQYASPHVQLGEIIRYAWCREMMTTEALQADWVRIVVRALQAQSWKPERPLDPRTGKPVLPVRVHSSGDFFSPAYARAWIEVCNALPDVMFWAPTRTWAAPKWNEHWKRLVPLLKHGNLSLRPSAYHTGDPAPTEKNHPWSGPDFPYTSEGTTAIYKFNDEGEGKDPRYAWACRTYAIVDEAHTCQKALAPDGQIGCRACWIRPDLSVNYAAH